MRIIIEADGASPEIIVRSAAASGTLPGRLTTASETPLDATDAGPAPAVAGRLDTAVAVTAPSAAPAFDPAGVLSAGAAPTFSTEG